MHLFFVIMLKVRKAFERLKTIFVNTFILKHYDWDADFHMKINAFNHEVENMQKLIMLNWIIKIESSFQLVKTWFESEFLTWVFKSSQNSWLNYLSWVRRLRSSIDLKFSIWLIKTWSEVLLIFIWVSDNATE